MHILYTIALILYLNTLSASEPNQEQSVNKTVTLKNHLIKAPQENTTYIYHFTDITEKQLFCKVTFKDDFTNLIVDIKNGILYDHKMKIKNIYNVKNAAFISPMEYKMWFGKSPSGITISFQNELIIPKTLFFKKNTYAAKGPTVKTKFWIHDEKIIARLEKNLQNSNIEIKIDNQIHKYPLTKQVKLSEIHKSFMLANEKSLQDQASETCTEIRAHYLAEELFKLGFYPLKAWVHKKGKITHVSILLELENAESKKNFVIYDPWTDNSQTPIKEWVEANSYTEISISSFHKVSEHFLYTNHEAYFFHKNSLDAKYQKELQNLRQTPFLNDSFYGEIVTLQTPQITSPEKAKRYEYTYQANEKSITCTILLEGDWNDVKTIDLQNGMYFKKNNLPQQFVNGHWGYHEGNYISIEEYKKFFNQEKAPDLILKHENLIVFPNLIRLRIFKRDNETVVNFWFQYQEKLTTKFWSRDNIALRIHSDLRNDLLNNGNIPIVTANYIHTQKIIKDEKELRLIFRRFMQANKKHLNQQLLESTGLCMCRSHYVSQNLFKLGFYPYKIWKYWDKQDWKEYPEDKQWYYHVAVLIEVKYSNDLNKRLIFDPWVSGHKLLCIEEWINCPNEPRPIRIDISSFHQLFPYPICKPINHEGYTSFLKDSKLMSETMEKLNKYPFITVNTSTTSSVIKIIYQLIYSIHLFFFQTNRL